MTTALTVRNILRSIPDLFSPRCCLVCGRPLNLREEHLCLPCLADIPETHFSNMRSNPMADRLNDNLDAPAYLFATALFHYTGQYSEITKAVKFRRNPAAGRYFASMLADAIRQAPHFDGIDTVCPVPLYWSRYLERGYNQAAIVAEEIAVRLGTTYRNLLCRTRRTKRQADIGGGDGQQELRESNVAGAFSVRKSHADGKTMRHILLVDDVFTTGATCKACIRALQKCYGKDIKVSVAALAFAGSDF